MKEYIYWREDAQEEDEIQGGMYFRSMKMGKFIKDCEAKGYKMLGIKLDESNNCEFLFIPPELDISKLKVGDKVHYQPSHFAKTEWENGMIKEIPDFVTDKTATIGYNCIRVVYNCGGDWKHFKKYTSALTNLNDLKLGWKN